MHRLDITGYIEDICGFLCGWAQVQARVGARLIEIVLATAKVNQERPLMWLKRSLQGEIIDEYAVWVVPGEQSFSVPVVSGDVGNTLDTGI